MKKQFFLLTSLLIASANFYAATSCNTDCKTSCNTSTSCKDICVPDHGHTFRRMENAFQSASPILASQFNSNVVRNLENEDKHGGLEVTVFGGKSTSKSEAACYFFPYGHTTYNVDGTVDAKIHAGGLALSKITTAAKLNNASGLADNDALPTQTLEISGPGSTRNGIDNFDIDSNAFTLKFDSNKDTSKILPWNFGVTFAALFEPFGASATGQLAGSGLVTQPEFKSKLSPTYEFSHVGAGLGLRYHFSDDKNGFFGTMSTSVERVSSHLKLNESDITNKTELNSTNFPANANPRSGITVTDGLAQLYTTNDANAATANATADANLAGSINTAYINGTTGTGFLTGDSAPANMEAAFVQSAWKYGKIGCEQTVTRLADIELAVGYQWLCNDCASTSWSLGVVIPTGNKPCAEYVAPAVVGNGQHGGILSNATLDLMLKEDEDCSVWYRLDTSSRYLFRNTQKRSFDLRGNEWSRYMMVWENEAAYTAAVTAINATTFPAQRGYTPGINVFTEDMKVKPGFQTRINQAVYYQSECLRAEMGWNVLSRSKECVEFACPWDKKPAFADSSYVGGVALNNHRTIYNDAQLMSENAVGIIDPTNSIAAATPNGPATLAAGSTSNAITPVDSVLSSRYSDYAIVEKDANLDSAATPAVLIHTPYLTVGYAWDSDCKPAMSVGASYEFSAGNRAVNKWMVWGKFELAF